MIVTPQEIELMIQKSLIPTLWNLINNRFLKIDLETLDKVPKLASIIYTCALNLTDEDLCQCTDSCNDELKEELVTLISKHFEGRDFAYIVNSDILNYGFGADILPKGLKIKYGDFLLVLNDQAKMQILLDFLKFHPSRYNPNEIDEKGETILFKMEREEDIMAFIKIYIYDVTACSLKEDYPKFNHYLTNYMGDYWIAKRVVNRVLTLENIPGAHAYYREEIKYVEKNIPLMLTAFDPHKKGYDAKGKDFSSYAEMNRNSKFVSEFNGSPLAKKLIKLL